MAKNFFTNPYILLGVIDDDEGDEGYAVSGQTGLVPFPVNYQAWFDAAQGDPSKDLATPTGIWDQADYVAWWVACANAGYPGFTRDKFNELNPVWDYDKP